MPTPDAYITLEEFRMWLQHPITRIVHSARRRQIDDLRIDLGRGGTLDVDNLNSTALNTAFRVGMIQGLEDAFEPPETVLLQGEGEEDDSE
jgi:hypothetical protein